jgi:hypothetical protein
MTTWLYERDYPTTRELMQAIEAALSLGHRVFVQGYSAIDVKEYHHSNGQIRIRYSFVS